MDGISVNTITLVSRESGSDEQLETVNDASDFAIMLLKRFGQVFLKCFSITTPNKLLQIVIHGFEQHMKNSRKLCFTNVKTICQEFYGNVKAKLY